MITDKNIIDNLGGSTEVSVLCEISPQAVSQWKKNGIPKPQRKFLSLLRPEAFTDNTSTPKGISHDAR